MTVARTMTESRRVIPREWQISNPIPPYSPPIVPPDGESPFPFFDIYRDFVRQVLPRYDEQLSLDTLPSPAVLFMKEAFARSEPTGIYHELMLRQFLQTCQVTLLKLIARPGLTQSALLHHELVMAAGLIQQRGLSVDMVNFCDMLLAEILDIYQSTFANVITQKYWSKTRGVEEVITHLLLKELELFRQLDGYSFSILASAMMRRALESAPAAAISPLTKWGQENQINFE
jgi:hypothetical protein